MGLIGFRNALEGCYTITKIDRDRHQFELRRSLSLFRRRVNAHADASNFNPLRRELALPFRLATYVRARTTERYLIYGSERRKAF